MRRLFFAILAIIYLVATTGATLHMHYCMGRLAGTGLWKDDSGHCGLCGMEKTDDDDNGCCNDTQEDVKIQVDQQHVAGDAFHFEQPFTDIIFNHPFYHPQAFIAIGDKVQPVSHAPPRSPQQPPYLLFRNFRI
jgi:hypothetical protein